MAQLTHPDAMVASAIHDAEQAAAQSQVHLRELSSVEEQADAIGLLSAIWKRTPQNPPVPPELLRAMSKAGNYIGGAFAGDLLVGVAIAFHATPERHALHSHIAGISATHAGRSVGFALKQHQRAWALARDIDVIEWTFDPLVARNAYFNIMKLGARPIEYLANFYGEIADGVNTDDETDRLLVRWDLRNAETIACAAGATRRVEPLSTDVTVAVPTDIETTRREDPPLGREWRYRIREQLTDLLDAGNRIEAFTRTDGYIVRSGKDS